MDQPVEPLRTHYLVYIAPDVDGVHLFSSKHGEKLTQSVQGAIKAEVDPEIKFEFTGFDRGRYKFVCSNEPSRIWAVGIIPMLKELWEDAKLKLLDIGIVSKMIKATTTFTGRAPETLTLFEGIEKKNPNIDTLHWRAYKHMKVSGNKTVIFLGIDEESLKPLKEVGLRPYFEGGRIKIVIKDE